MRKVARSPAPARSAARPIRRPAARLPAHGRVCHRWLQRAVHQSDSRTLGKARPCRSQTPIRNLITHEAQPVSQWGCSAQSTCLDISPSSPDDSTAGSRFVRCSHASHTPHCAPRPCHIERSNRLRIMRNQDRKCRPMHCPSTAMASMVPVECQPRRAGSRSTRASPIATSMRPRTKLWVTVSPRIQAARAAPDTGVMKPRLIIVLGR